MVFGSLFAAVLNGVDPRHAGSASGTLNAVQQVGGAIGVALIGVVFFTQLSHAAPASFSTVEPRVRSALISEHVPTATQPAIIGGIEHCFVDRSREKDSSVTPPSCNQLSSHTSQDKQLVTVVSGLAAQANATNFTNAFRWSIIFTIGLLAAVAVCTFFLPARFKASAYTEM
jgi:hypothetical protein